MRTMTEEFNKISDLMTEATNLYNERKVRSKAERSYLIKRSKEIGLKGKPEELNELNARRKKLDIAFEDELTEYENMVIKYQTAKNNYDSHRNSYKNFKRNYPGYSGNYYKPDVSGSILPTDNEDDDMILLTKIIGEIGIENTQFNRLEACEKFRHFQHLANSVNLETQEFSNILARWMSIRLVDKSPTELTDEMGLHNDILDVKFDTFVVDGESIRLPFYWYDDGIYRYYYQVHNNKMFIYDPYILPGNEVPNRVIVNVSEGVSEIGYLPDIDNPGDPLLNYQFNFLTNPKEAWLALKMIMTEEVEWKVDERMTVFSNGLLNMDQFEFTNYLLELWEKPCESVIDTI